VSQTEFQQMVQDISHETAAPGSVAAKTRERERLAEAEAEKTREREAAEKQVEPEPQEDLTADARPEDLVLKDNKRDKPKRSRNKRHGRPR
jgi:SecD/SecF fusion protein